MSSELANGSDHDLNVHSDLVPDNVQVITEQTPEGLGDAILLLPQNSLAGKDMTEGSTLKIDGIEQNVTSSVENDTHNVEPPQPELMPWESEALLSNGVFEIANDDTTGNKAELELHSSKVVDEINQGTSNAEILISNATETEAHLVSSGAADINHSLDEEMNEDDIEKNGEHNMITLPLLSTSVIHQDDSESNRLDLNGFEVTSGGVTEDTPSSLVSEEISKSQDKDEILQTTATEEPSGISNYKQDSHSDAPQAEEKNSDVEDVLDSSHVIEEISTPTEIIKQNEALKEVESTGIDASNEDEQDFFQSLLLDPIASKDPQPVEATIQTTSVSLDEPVEADLPAKDDINVDTPKLDDATEVTATHCQNDIIKESDKPDSLPISDLKFSRSADETLFLKPNGQDEKLKELEPTDIETQKEDEPDFFQSLHLNHIVAQETEAVEKIEQPTSIPPDEIDGNNLEAANDIVVGTLKEDGATEATATHFQGETISETAKLDPLPVSDAKPVNDASIQDSNFHQQNDTGNETAIKNSSSPLDSCDNENVNSGQAQMSHLPNNGLTSVLDEFAEESLTMPWDEVPQNSTTEESEKEKDAFAFLEDSTNDDTLNANVDVNVGSSMEQRVEKSDDLKSVKSFSFLEEEFEPLLDDEEPLPVEQELNQVQATPVVSSLGRSNNYTPQSQVATGQSNYQPQLNTYAPIQTQQTQQTNSLKTKKSFFEELPAVSQTSHSRLSVPVKSNPYAAIVQSQQQHQHEAVNMGPPPAASLPMLPPKNPYAPSTSTLKLQLEKEYMIPSIPQPFTAKESLAQSFNHPKSPSIGRAPMPISTVPRNTAPLRTTSRASSVASKSFFEDLPVLKSPTSATHTPKNPYAPLVAHNNPLHTPYGIPQVANPLNSYGVDQSHRRMGSQGNNQQIPPQALPQSPHNPYGLNAVGSRPPQLFLASGYQNIENLPYQPGFVGQQHAAPYPQQHSRTSSLGNRSRKSTYLPPSLQGAPQLSKTNVYAPMLNLNITPDIVQHQSYPQPAPAVSSKYAPAPAAHLPPQNNTSIHPLPHPIYNPQHVQHNAALPSLVPPQRHNYPQVQSQFQNVNSYNQVGEQIDNFQVQPNIEFSKQFPIFRFNRSKKIAKVIYPGSIDIVDTETLSDLNPLDKKFEPLSKQKTKKAVAESWIDEKIKYLSETDPTNHSLRLIYVILKELVKGDGEIKDSSPIIKELAKTSSFHFKQGVSSLKQSISLLKVETPMESIAFSLFSYLQEGKKEEGLQYLVGQKNWPLSFIVASLLNPESVLGVINQYLLETFSEDKNSTSYVLYFVLNILSGNSKSMVDLVANDPESFNYFTQNFSLILSLVLQNGIDLTSFFLEFSTFLIQNRMTLWGQALLLLSSAPLSEQEIKPGVLFSVVGANPLVDSGFERSIDVMCLTEIYEYALKLSSKFNLPSFGFPHLLRLKVSHASLLADNGCFVGCQKYTDYLPTTIKAAAKTFKIDPRVIAELEDLNARVTDTGETGWFAARPKLFGMIDKGFSKFIAGEDTTPAAKAADGVFTNYSPSISRTQSVADFGSPSINQARPAYTHSNSFIGFDTSAPSSGGFERRNSNPPSRGRYNSSMSMSNLAHNAAQYTQGQGSTPYLPQNGAPGNDSSAATLQNYLKPPNSVLHPQLNALLRDQVGLIQPPSFQPPYRAVSPSLKSDYNDDIADIRSTISKASNVSRYAPIPSQIKSTIPEESSQFGGSLYDNEPQFSGLSTSSLPPNAQIESGFQQQASVADSQYLYPLLLKAESHKSYVSSPIAQKSVLHQETSAVSKVSSRRNSNNSYIPPPVISPSLPRKSLSYNTPAYQEDDDNNLSNTSFGIGEETQGDIYRETPSKPSQITPAPINPYAMPVANKARRNNRYAPPSNLHQSNAAGNTVLNASIDAFVSGDVDIYSYGGYARPSPLATDARDLSGKNNVTSQTDNANFEPTASQTANTNFEPMACKSPRGSVSASNENDRGDFHNYTTSHFTPHKPSHISSVRSYSPHVPSELDDDEYDDDVVDDDDDDDEDDARAKAAAAKAEEKKKIEAAKLLEKRKHEEELRREKENAKAGWFGGIFGRKGDKEEKKVYKAKLGEQSHFYYDEKLKRWVNQDNLGDADEIATPPPPPPTIKIPKKLSDTPLPPSAVAPPSRAPAKQGPPRPSSNFSSPPPGGKVTPAKKEDIDDILTMASTTKSLRSKRGPRRGYVDVMNQ